MEDTWFSRELPVLEALVSIFEAGFKQYPNAQHVAEAAGLDKDTAHRSLKALDGEYIVYNLTGGGGGFVKSISSAARRAVGQWPTPESFVDRLAEALADEAEKTSDAEKKSMLRKAAGAFGGGARDLIVDVAGAALSRGMGLG